jgi:hypothetical protein
LNTLWTFWMRLATTFGDAGAVLVLCIGAVGLELAIAATVITWRAVRRRIRHHRVGRELEQIRAAAYRERPPGGPYAA